MLPREGGLLDQDSFLMSCIDMVIDAQYMKRELDMQQQEAQMQRANKLGKAPVMM